MANTIGNRPAVVVLDYTRHQINLCRMFFAHFSVNSQPIFMNFCKDYFRVTQRLIRKYCIAKNLSNVFIFELYNIC